MANFPFDFPATFGPSDSYGGMFEANIVVQHQVWIEGAKNNHGNPVDDWETAVQRRVIAVYPLHRLPHHDVADSTFIARTMIDWIMEVPDPTIYHKNDRVIFDGENYRVMGRPINWGAGNPFGFDNTFFGGAVHIERVT